tara:strand:+ start:1127 stop:1768 length:642 start_codon:yes stop_codon:yes gene_type:complete
MGREIRFKNPKAPGTFKQLKGAACHLSNILAKDLKLDLKEKPGRRNKYQLQGVIYTVIKKRLFKPDNKTLVKDPLTMEEMSLFMSCKTFPPHLLIEVKEGMKKKHGKSKPTVMTKDEFLQIYGHKAVAARLKEKAVNGNGLYKIEKNIPVPKQQGRPGIGPHAEIAAQMNVGDSVLLNKTETNKLCSLMHFRNQKACRRIQEDGKSWRVWRIK